MQIILTHTNADFDAVAALIAAHKLYPDATPILPRRLNHNVNEFISLYQNGLAFAEWDDFFLTTPSISKIILVDTQSVPDVPGANANTVLKIIDHHPLRKSESKYTEIEHDIEPIGATTTLLAETIRNQHIKLTSLEATLFALGIYEDTGSLTYKGTSVRDINIVSWLIERQAALDTVRRFLSYPLSPLQQRVFENLIKNTDTRDIQGYNIAISATTSDEYVEQVNSITHRLRDILDPAGLFVLVKMPGGIQIVCRANSQVLNVGDIAKIFGGGGHAVAAAAHVENRPLNNVIDQLWGEINKRVAPITIVADLMSYGVQTVDINAKLRDVIQNLRRIGHEGYPVLENDKVVGLLTRRDADRALEYDLDNATVREIMQGGKVTLRSKDSVSKLEQLMVESGWGQIPVIDEHDVLIGIVTRTDLIQHWVATHPTKDRQYPTINHDKISQILDKPIVQLIDLVADYAHRKSTSIYLVGGVVRDLLLQRPNYDIDFVVESNAITFAEGIAEECGGSINSYQPFGTAKWILDHTLHSTNDKHTLPHHIDFATSRNEFYAHPTALPTVYSSSIKLDLHRRDFTINTLAIQISPLHMQGRILDFYNGLSDLNQKIIRVLHSLSFVDDPTRILRAVRFEQRLGFMIEPRTSELIETALPMLQRITGERLRNELTLMLNEPLPEHGFRKLHNRGILHAIHPSFQMDDELETHFKQVREETIDWVVSIDDMCDFLWHILLSAVPHEHMQSLCERLLFSKSLAASFEQTAYLKQVPERIAHEQLNDSQVVKTLDDISEIALGALLIVSEDESVITRVRQYLTTWQHIRPSTTGHTLREAGLAPGPYYRTILEQLRDAWIDGTISNEGEERELRDRLIAEAMHDKS